MQILYFADMFTGIIETIGSIITIEQQETNKIFWLKSAISEELKIDQSVAHNGVCLTVEEIKNGMHRVTAIQETLLKTNLNTWKINDPINLERCVLLNGRMDGHFVQGHVDTTATCIQCENQNGSWLYRFKLDEQFASLIIEKGSISINGISLTIFNVTQNEFSVAVIPYTFDHTNMQAIAKDSLANIEFDMVGKYIHRYMQLMNGKNCIQ